MFNGQKILITAGPTHEPIDPVRFIGNRSSGKMGYAIAEELAQRGAEVVLVSGPVELGIEHQQIKLIPVETAAEMYDACMKEFDHCNGAILSAAVADFTPLNPVNRKIKKNEGEDNLTIQLKKTKDILASLGRIKRAEQFLVGFSLETDNELENAQLKLKKKNCNIIIMNSLRDEGAGFGFDTNKISLITDSGTVRKFALKSKKEVAIDIIDSLEYYLKKRV